EDALLTYGHDGVLVWTRRKHPDQPGLYHFERPQSLVQIQTGERMGISADGRLLAVPRFHACGLLVDRDRPDRPKWWLAPQCGVRFADVSPDGRWIATGSHIAEEVPIKIWDARTGKHIADLPAYTGGIVRFSPDGRWLATMGLQFRLWKTSDWSEG